jgi:hypothetical protein
VSSIHILLRMLIFLYFTTSSSYVIQYLVHDSCQLRHFPLTRTHAFSPTHAFPFCGLDALNFFSIATHCIFLNEFKKILVQISFQFLILGCSSHINPLIPYKCISKIELTRHGRHIIFSNIILKRVVFHLRFFIYTFKLRYF